MDFSQTDRETIILGLQSREERIVYMMEQLLDQIINENKTSRVEKHINKIYDGWRMLQETRQLRERIQRTLSDGKPPKESKTNNVHSLKNDDSVSYSR
ncbi:MAG: hypothetical protein M0Z65_06280 [Firmicutes bacterium]|uniref:Uncharacterized protein n=1 Tax=Melghirimyces thermohalophilus TaxID=1236220 RepID=A0A1G6N568_9BACL|nr:hypothetical protein [Melghirimyces thermohalophilus]MDA8352788.1 hypothetical protein [Bacillota bacterium]SDC62992.1 hypothetical protein SAMN04488112_1123 [Melghirimyces thermohalophilus]